MLEKNPGPDGVHKQASLRAAKELRGRAAELRESFFRDFVIEKDGKIEMVAHAIDRKSTRLNSSHSQISYAVFCLKKKKKKDCRFRALISTTSLSLAVYTGSFAPLFPLGSHRYIAVSLQCSRCSPDPSTPCWVVNA